MGIDGAEGGEPGAGAGAVPAGGVGTARQQGRDVCVAGLGHP